MRSESGGDAGGDGLRECVEVVWLKLSGGWRLLSRGVYG